MESPIDVLAKEGIFIPAEIRTKKIEHLIPYPNNARTHSKEQIARLAGSIKEFGFTNPVLIDKDNGVIAGHGRIDAAKLLGILEVPTICLDRLTEAQKKAYIIADNRLALDAGWDDEMLAIEVGALRDIGYDLKLTGLDDVELTNAMKRLDPTQCEPQSDEDEVPELTINSTTKMGDIWLLGNHRLICADSTQIDAIDKLMAGEQADMVFTDPPYNTGMTPESQKGSGGLWKGDGKSSRLSHMFNDSFTPDEWQNLLATFMATFMATYWYVMKDDSVAYICLDWRRNHELIPHIENNGFHRSNLIVWDKVVHGLGSDYKYTHEFINVCKKGKPKLDTHQGDREYSDVWHIQRKMGKDEDHATKKPIELVERALRHASKTNDLVVDLFGGSGSTLIACAKMNRKCYMAEIDPRYVDIIINRWQKFTGKKAIHEESQKLFDEMSPLV